MSQTTLTAKEYKNYFEKAISYEDYLENFQEEIKMGDKSPFAQYLPQNWQRQSRLDRKLKLTDHLTNAIEKIQKPIKWLLITEHWCGDASQINPIINAVSKLSEGKIDLKLIYRDQNIPLIDAHLTDGKSRSIPILLQLDENHQLLSSYGPRPDEAQTLVKAILAEEKPYSIPLHTWYAKDKQQAIQYDLTKLISSIL